MNNKNGGWKLSAHSAQLQPVALSKVANHKALSRVQYEWLPLKASYGHKIASKVACWPLSPSMACGTLALSGPITRRSQEYNMNGCLQKHHIWSLNYRRSCSLLTQLVCGLWHSLILTRYLLLLRHRKRQSLQK